MLGLLFLNKPLHLKLSIWIPTIVVPIHSLYLNYGRNEWNREWKNWCICGEMLHSTEALCSPPASLAWKPSQGLTGLLSSQFSKPQLASLRNLGVSKHSVMTLQWTLGLRNFGVANVANLEVGLPLALAQKRSVCLAQAKKRHLRLRRFRDMAGPLKWIPFVTGGTTVFVTYFPRQSCSENLYYILFVFHLY